MLVTASTDLQKDIVEGGRVSLTSSGTFELLSRKEVRREPNDLIVAMQSEGDHQ